MVSGKTEVYATIDGIVKHRHDGVKGWHSAHIVHADATFHATAAEADVSGLTPELQARYVEALGGKSFEYLWAPRSRHAEVRTRSPRAAKDPTAGKVWDEYLLDWVTPPAPPTAEELLAEVAALKAALAAQAVAEAEAVLAKTPAKK